MAELPTPCHLICRSQGADVRLWRNRRVAPYDRFLAFSSRTPLIGKDSKGSS